MLAMLRGLLLGALFTASRVMPAEGSTGSEKGITFSHVYKIDSGCGHSTDGSQAALLSQDRAESQITTVDSGNDIVFKHNIRLASPGCNCADSEDFKSLLYRLNGLEEEVAYLKNQCTQGCCAGSSGVDTNCSGHGTYQHDSCSCRCEPGWAGPDCSASTCPDDCNDNGSCVDGRCVCHAGYTGHDCGLLACPDNCSDKGRCVDGRCECFEGFTGDDCSERRCPGDCAENGRCVDGRCVCFEGFTGDDCSERRCPGDCAENGRCVDGRCVCFEGFTGDDCSERRCPGDCAENGRCVDGRCVCFEGFTGDDCSERRCPGDCAENGRCVDGRCVCFEGFTGDDCSERRCPGDCAENGRCVDGRCVCFEGFTGDDCSERRCPGDCAENGRCVDGRCVCDEGFFRDDCSMVLEPKGLRLVSATDTSLLVEWEHVSGADHYVLSYHPEGAAEDVQEVRVPNMENTYLITGLRPALTYVVRVYAVIKALKSDPNRIVATTGVSGVEGIRVLGQTVDSIQVDWQNPETEVDFFKLRHASPDGHEEQENVARSQEARTRHTIVGLNPGTEYQITVQAVRANSEGKPSQATGVTDIDAPTNLVTRDVTETTATVTWDRVLAEIDGYMLTYSSAEGSSPEVRLGEEASSHQLASLKPGVLYTVFIWAYKGPRSSRKSSTEAETEIDAPRNLQAVDVQTKSAALTWRAPQAYIDGYILRYRPEDGSMQSTEKNLAAGEARLSLSDLAMGKKYVTTLMAYRGTKRSKEVETSFSTVGILDPFPMDCTQLMKNGHTESGVYTIYVAKDRSRPMQVFCDMTTDGGGWIVFQRRNSGKLDFMKRWKQYTQGFGDLTDEFWLGLEKLHELTNTPTQYEVRFDLGLGTERVFAVYDNFKIAPAKQKFKLTVGNYRGNAGDAMTYHQGRPFTTVDSDNDVALGNCALTHRGAWWFKNCHLANLNGKYGDNRHSVGVNWEPWKGHLMSLDFTEIKLRPVSEARRKKRSAKRRATV